jgi:putative SOS response-associated peptidase YedK
VELEDMPWFAHDYNVAPQIMEPVVRLNRDTGKREFALMRWGLVPYWAKNAKIGYSTINARAEEAAITDPNELAERVHDRMPVILDPQDCWRWMGACGFRRSGATAR